LKPRTNRFVSFFPYKSPFLYLQGKA
jgi:hypothetical protein